MLTQCADSAEGACALAVALARTLALVRMRRTTNGVAQCRWHLALFSAAPCLRLPASRVPAWGCSQVCFKSPHARVEIPEMEFEISAGEGVIV